MNTSDVLNKAADHIAKYGLCTDGSGHGPGDITTAPACVIGAINLATWGDTKQRQEDVAEPARAALRNYLDGKCIPLWSDGSTAADVIETLRAAAIIAAAQEVDVRVVAPEAELTAVSLADVAGAVV